MIKAVNIVKDYGDDKSQVLNHVIKTINLEVNDGEFVVITGKSGSGKTTLLYLLSGLEPASAGDILYNEINLKKCSDKQLSKLRRTKFGFVFQFYNLISSFNVRDNIFLPIEIYKKVSKEEKEKVYEFIRIMEIENILDKYPYQLSGGQKQRVAIARALAIDPDIIFADEPTGNLDSVTGKSVLDIFCKLNEVYGKTIIMVTHDISVCKNYKVKNIQISDGKVL